MNKLSKIGLQILSSVYGSAVFLRNMAYDRKWLTEYHIDLPVICVGNIAVGGSGKTPFVQYLTRLIQEEHRGIKPAILLRGYGGMENGPYVVNFKDRPALVGDEAVLHRRLLPTELAVVVARDRVAGCRLIAKENLGNCIILDDGYQHRRLARTLNLMLVNEEDIAMDSLYPQENLLPAGRLREPVARGLNRADLVVRVAKEVSTIGFRALNISKPMINFCLTPIKVCDWITGESYDLTWFKNRKVKAISGLARNESFAHILLGLGVQVQEHLKYPDHWSYSKEDWQQATTDGVDIITTAKDAVKLLDFEGRSGKLMVLELGGTLDEQQKAKLQPFIAAILH